MGVGVAGCPRSLTFGDPGMVSSTPVRASRERLLHAVVRASRERLPRRKCQRKPTVWKGNDVTGQ